MSKYIIKDRDVFEELPCGGVVNKTAPLIRQIEALFLSAGQRVSVELHAGFYKGFGMAYEIPDTKPKPEETVTEKCFREIAKLVDGMGRCPNTSCKRFVGDCIWKNSSCIQIAADDPKEQDKADVLGKIVNNPKISFEEWVDMMKKVHCPFKNCCHYSKDGCDMAGEKCRPEKHQENKGKTD